MDPMPAHRQTPGQTRERGTALIAALLLVALMSAISVQLIDLSRFAVFRTANTLSRADAYWYALGAREFSEGIVLQSLDGDVMRSDMVWLDNPQVFPIEGGAIAGTIRDGNNCLNINALAGPSEDETNALTRQTASARAGVKFQSLMREIAAPPGVASRLQAQITDWIDTNSRPEAGGAEDDLYQRYDPPYRAANQPMVELEEMLALPDMTPSLFQALRPWLCVRPVTIQPALNVNTLRLDQAPLLVSVFEGQLSLADAEAVLFRRPPRGYGAVEEFWTDPILAQLDSEQIDRSRVAVTSQWFEMNVQVNIDDSVFVLSQLAEYRDGTTMARHQQRFGPAS